MNSQLDVSIVFVESLVQSERTALKLKNTRMIKRFNVFTLILQIFHFLLDVSDEVLSTVWLRQIIEAAGNVHSEYADVHTEYANVMFEFFVPVANAICSILYVLSHIAFLPSYQRMCKIHPK